MFDPSTLALSIPIVAIVMGIGSGMLKSYFRHQERRLELMAMHRQGGDEDVTTAIAQLRAEMAELRDTTTKYDMSIQSHMEDLGNRLAALETRNRYMSPSEEDAQKVRLGN
jgi:hypothetical protein